MLKQYYEKNKIEIGIDEAGRGCLFGPVCVAAVVWLNEDPDNSIEIKDSKKIKAGKRTEINNYIKNNCIAYDIQLIDSEHIDKYNILESTLEGMHKCIDTITSYLSVDRILVDGPHFNFYKDIPHTCVINGDNTYKSIACGSILAKTYRDDWIDELVKNYPELEKYDIKNNKGYGTKKHLEAIQKYGLTKWHRKTFGICKNYT